VSADLPARPDVLAWPVGGKYDEKAAALDEIARREPRGDQADILVASLADEASEHFATKLLWQVCRHRGFEREENGKTCLRGWEPLTRAYQEALGRATSAGVRIALHRAFASYNQDQPISGDRAELFASRLAKADSTDEQRALLSLLQSRAHYDDTRLLRIATSWLANERRSLTKEDIEVWRDTLVSACKKDERGATRIRAEAAEILLKALPRLGDLEACALAIEILGSDLRTDESDRVLMESLHRAEPEVRRAALSGVAATSVGSSEVRRILASDADDSVLGAAWDALQKAGDDPVTLLLELARNPHLKAATDVVRGRVLHSENLSMLRRAWPALAAPFRSELESRWRHDGEWMERRFHHPMWRELWHDLLHRGRPDGVASAAAISWVTRPLHDVLGVYDFDTITGLRRDDPVEIRTERVFRFGFLADAESGDGAPLRDVLTRRREFDLDDLAELEVRYDQERDDVARLARQINELATQLGDEVLAVVRRWTLLGERPRFEKLGEQLGPAGERLAHLLKEHVQRQQQLAGQGEGPFWGLHQASRHLAEFLPRVGCRFDGLVAPDGVLGEYNCEDRSVTLFGPMIELAAGDAARSLGRPVDEIAPLARTIVELHELAHAHVHLGRDASRGLWGQPEDATAAFHEGLAQSYTRRIVAEMNEPRLREVLGAMEAWLPPEYRFADLLDDVDAERLRSWFVSRRHVQPARTLDDVVGSLLKAVPGYLRIVESTLGRQPLSATVARLRAALKAAIDANSHERPASLDALLSVLAEQPNAAPILGAFLVGGWPSDDDRRWLLHEARIAGTPVGKRPLRFIRKRDRIMAISESKTAAELGLGAALRACEIVALAVQQSEPSAPQPVSRGSRRKRRGREAAT
jgi:hypothetical protein